MRSCLAITGVLALLFVTSANAQDEVATPPPAGITDVAPALPVERPKPPEKPKAEKPKPVEKPRLEMENTGTQTNPVATSVKPSEAVAPVGAPLNSAVTPPPPATGRTGNSFGCLALAFAMLILGIAAGFLGRHLMSRHKLGGMTVRIGTWRGIP